MRKQYLIVNEKDNVATALVDLLAGSTIIIQEKDLELELIDSIPTGHKFSLVSIATDDFVVKYGEVIGVATAPIKQANHVHVHNMDSNRGRGDKN